jgi:sulfoxide reductase heme-binding subunit YedZ
MATAPAPPSSIQPLGTNGDQRRRFLLHHMPLALASALLLVLFMTGPLFDAHAYEQGDIVSGTFPQARSTARPADHGGDHAGHTALGGHGQRSVRRPAERESMGHAGGNTGSRHHGGSNTEPKDQREDSSLARKVQRFTVATGYVGVGFLAFTLLLGPANLLLRRRNPVSSYLRRDAGIWTAIFSIVHVISAVLMHVSHGSGVISSFVHFFVAQDGAPLTNSFGLGNWTGLAASAIVLGLLATSSDVALRKLRAAPWKWLQRLTYALFGLVILHAFFYGALLRMTSPFTLLLVISLVTVLVGQGVGFWLWQRMHSGIAPSEGPSAAQC